MLSQIDCIFSRKNEKYKNLIKLLKFQKKDGTGVLLYWWIKKKVLLAALTCTQKKIDNTLFACIRKKFRLYNLKRLQ